ncbi:hypothetical protein DM02DRAFT_724010 [Periconia macrospinosa]|uniref:Uncharacterized protein n=1 Tax=Periconia macrospinosa TaxID=97972 RepID=A0A2V1E915_9PLEO|nr:hypothetical protein DM02DRAFT_724010 [Periconia macrospinosa]
MAMSLARHVHGSGGSGGNGRSSSRSSAFAVHFGLGAFTRNVARLAASVAGLAGSVERAAVRSSAVARDVTKLAASVALHGLSLAVASKVVGSAALVAGGRATTSKATPEATTISATRSTTAAHGTGARVRAVAGQVSGKTARVASSARASSAQAQSWAVSLHMAKALAVVALLGLGSARVGASVGLVAGLLACGMCPTFPHLKQARRDREDMLIVILPRNSVERSSKQASKQAVYVYEYVCRGFGRAKEGKERGGGGRWCEGVNGSTARARLPPTTGNGNANAAWWQVKKGRTDLLCFSSSVPSPGSGVGLKYGEGRGATYKSTFQTFPQQLSCVRRLDCASAGDQSGFMVDMWSGLVARSRRGFHARDQLGSYHTSGMRNFRPTARNKLLAMPSSSATFVRSWRVPNLSPLPIF